MVPFSRRRTGLSPVRPHTPSEKDRIEVIMARPQAEPDFDA